MKALVANIQTQGKKYVDQKEKQLRAQQERDAKNYRASQEAADGRVIEQGVADYLFVDDKKVPADVNWVQLPNPPVWRIIRTFDEFKDYLIANGIPKFVALDSDLGPQSKGNGPECAKYLVSLCQLEKKPLPEWAAVSAIQTGRQAVENVLLNARV